MTRYALALILFFVMTVPASAGEELHVATLDAPPMVIVKGDEITGMAADLARAALERAGYEPTIDVVPWKRAVHMASLGDADALFYAVHNDEREKVFHYPSVPLFRIDIVALKQKDSAIVVFPPYQGLKRWTIGLGRGFAYGPKVMDIVDQADFKKVEITASNDLNFMKLLEYRIDILLADRTLAQHLRNKPEAKGQVDFVLDDKGEIVVFDSMDVYLVFSRKTRRAEDAKRLSDALEAMKADGSYQAIVDRYQYSDYSPAARSRASMSGMK